MAVRVLTLLTLIFGLTLGFSVASDNDPASLDFCKDYGEAFEHVFTVPHEAALLNCELVNEHVFDTLNTPYNVTWYKQRTGLKVTEEKQRTIIKDKSLWFLNVTTEHQGGYLCVVRTPDKCYKQETIVQVDEVEFGTCGRPQKGLQRLQLPVNDLLRCPLSDFTKGVDSYSIRWYKDCEPLREGQRFTFRRKGLELHVYDVSHHDAGLYTCRMTFFIAGVVSEVAETIECEIVETRSKRPQMIEPSNKIIKVAVGSRFNKTCRVFVPGLDVHMVAVIWTLDNSSVSLNTSDRIHQESLIERWVETGVWLERTLLVFPVLEDDLNLNFICRAFSYRGNPSRYFTLQLADPDLLLPIGLLLTLMALLFIMGVLLYRAFKVELVLLFRTLFPFFYASTDGDGKLYDAYVVYPQFEEDTSSQMVEVFAMKTLPQVLEGRYGYRLFILGRDSLPGQAIADVVNETMSLCRRLLLLYTDASLCRADGSAWLEQQAGLNLALIDDSLPVVLLEMKELSDPSVLPESLRLLRERQGAVQAWRRRRKWRCQGSEQDKEAQESLSWLTLPSRFWREVHYNMPVRGKARSHSRKNVLLNL
ncbi:interleukin-1 receptor-like 2 isoform X2 [Trichomycterus rosablanca]